MIIDENAPAAYLFQEGDFAIVMPEAVVAIMEVKTTLNSPDFKIAVDNIASAKKLMKFPATLCGIIFGYQGTNPSDENLDNWFKTTPMEHNGEGLSPNGIMFFEEGCLLMPHNHIGSLDIGGRYYHRIFRDESVKRDLNDAGWQLSIILAMVVSACERSEFTRTHILGENISNRLIQADGAMRGDERFEFGKGKSTLTT